jgi:predicted Zn finger-like uncharacterized protein
MIIECEQCGSKFNLDEGLLRDEGTMVRCSQCKHVFKAYPPGMGHEEQEVLEIEEFEAGSTLGSSRDFGPPAEEPVGEVYRDFDETLEEEAETSAFEEASPGLIRAREREEPAAEIDLEPISRMDQASKLRAREVISGKPKRVLMPSKASKPRRSSILPVVLIVIVLLLGGTTAVYFFAPQYIPESVTQFLPFLKGADRGDASDPGIRRLSFRAITGHFAESSKAGQLFVVKGMVVNNYSSNRSYILVKGSLLDDKGKAVRTKLAYVGNTFTDDEIKELTQDRISQAMRNRPGKNNIDVNVRPQAAIPFMLIFDELPDNLSEFTVEAVSSSPGE